MREGSVFSLFVCPQEVSPGQVPGEDPSHVSRQGWGRVDPSQITGPVPVLIWGA